MSRILSGPFYDRHVQGLCELPDTPGEPLP